MKQLDKYRKMRDFADTPEPSGAGTSRKKKKPIFVIQKHHASHLHYDFRLEMEGVLKSWAVPKGPSYDPGTKRLAMMTEDHPYDYAAFEGSIPEGNYGAGKVIIWDNGTWEFLGPADDPVEAVGEGKLTFRLDGKKMKGEWALIQLRGRSERGNEWLLLKHRDEFASENFEVTEEFPLSIVSNKDVEEIGSERKWKSNRPASAGKAPTVADALREKKAKTTSKVAAKPASSKAPAKPASIKATAKPASKGKKKVGKAAVSAKAPTRAAQTRKKR